MPTETKEVNAKAGLVKVSKAIVAALTKLEKDVDAEVLPPQGQASLEDYVRTALDRMTRMVADMEGMAEDTFAMVPEPKKEAADAKGHQSRQHV